MKEHPTLTALNIAELKTRLEDEKNQIERELTNIGARDPQNPKDWVATANDLSIDEADRNEAGDRFEELGENAGVLNELEIRLANIDRALEKIKKEEYGFSEITNNPIEQERLEANPAARTEIAHMNEEDTLSH